MPKPESGELMGCKGLCTKYKALKPAGPDGQPSGARYIKGQKRCQVCEIFMQWEGLWCPCCGYRLRTKPRNRHYKAKLRSKREKLLKEGKSIENIEPEGETNRKMMVDDGKGGFKLVKC